MRLYCCGVSDVGCVRTTNEDSIFAKQLKSGDYLFAVADGMGGHHAGDIASRRAVTELAEALDAGVPGSIAETLHAVFDRINARLYGDNQTVAANRRMGTTLTVMLARGAQAFVAHIGDSRLYHYRIGPQPDGQPHHMHRVTDDQSQVGALLASGAISEAEARVHPKRSVLNQAMGMREHVAPQLLGPLNIRPGDKFLLCSDGLTSVIDPDTFAPVFHDTSTSRIARTLVQLARTAGGPDNISAVVISTEPDTGSDTVPDIQSADATTPEIDAGASPAPAGRRPVRWFLLALLALLLAAMVYILVNSTRARLGGPSGTTPPAAAKGH